jgi:hypothetical protein
MPSRLGIIDPIRAPGGQSSSGIGSELENIRRQQPASGPLSRGLVVEVISDTASFTEEELSLISETLPGGLNSLRRAPRNSLIATIITGGGSSIQEGSVLCYPFFSPHFCMPIKPGEHVWVLNESPEGPSDHMFWMTRVNEADFLDDINFTHPERKFDLYIDKVESNGTLAAASGDDTRGDETRPFDGLKDPEKVPGPPAFTDGPIDDDDSDPTVPIIVDGNTVNIYDIVDQQSKGRRLSTREIVPRYTKRPGDLVLQGSNNALICLGQDRGWNSSERPDGALLSNASDEPVPFSGTIDIVVGRGRFYENTQPDPDSSEVADTQPRVIGNTREYLEVDKNPAAYVNDGARSSVAWNRLDRPQEGDPDFLADASRIYVSMSSPSDVSFNVSAETVTPLFEGELQDSSGPVIVLKSDEIRVIARKEVDREEINGSIRLIKEGTVGEDYASIFLLPDGVVQITGSKIYLGQPDQGSGPAEKGSEPYVKYSELESLLGKLFDNISDFCQTVLTHTTPGYGSPSIQINQAATSLQTESFSRKREISKLKSSRIFGE